MPTTTAASKSTVAAAAAAVTAAAVAASASAAGARRGVEPVLEFLGLLLLPLRTMMRLLTKAKSASLYASSSSICRCYVHARPIGKKCHGGPTTIASPLHPPTREARSLVFILICFLPDKRNKIPTI